MRERLRTNRIGLLLLLALPGAVAAAPAAAWLNLPNSARGSAMGGAGLALAMDVDAAGLNPAGLAGLKGRQAAFMHRVHVLDSSLEHVAYGFQAGEGLGLAASLDYLNFGSLERSVIGAGNQLEAAGTFQASGMNVDLGAGYALGALSLGANAKLVRQDLDGQSASVLAMDLGLRWGPWESGPSLGAVLRNVGGSLDGAGLPQALGLGAAYRLAVGNGVAAVAADLSLPGAMGAGLEYAGGELALRAGYRVAGSNGAGGLTLGGGFRFGLAQLDYAFNTVGDLGNAHQASALLRF